MRFTTIRPGGPWTAPDFNDSSWETCEFSQIAGLARCGRLFLRFERDLEWREINNSYFRARHGAPFEIWVNGKRKLHSAAFSRQWRNYTLDRRRAERIGRNVYAISIDFGDDAHFGDDARLGDDAQLLFEIEHVLGDWVEVEIRTAEIAPVIPDKIRDATAMRGPDGAFYLTGTTGPDEFFGEYTPRGWLLNDGIQIFRSLDLKKWESLGYVWQFERDGTWNRDFGTFNGRGPARAVFAPKIHFISGKWWISYCVNSLTPTRSFGVSLLYADAPDGPFTDVSPQKPLDGGFDANLFEDDGGEVWMLRNECILARLNSAMNGFTGAPREIAAANFPHIGFEGASLFKYRDRYFLCAAEWNIHADGSESYDCMVATATAPGGPYGERYLALRFGGHNAFFVGENGALHATIWANTRAYEQVSIVEMEFDEDGKLRPRARECE